MGLRIKTNVDSLVAQRQLADNRSEMQDSLQKLSSGLRINKSSDDAAGLAVSENMRAKIRGLAVAKRNAGDGISMLQVAEGGLSELNNLMIRMRELTTQAASDSIGSQERTYLDREFSELGKEVTRIKEDTEFNGTKILNPSEAKDLGIQVGVSYHGGNSEANPDSDVIKINFGQIDTLTKNLDELKQINIRGENGRELGDSKSTDEVFKSLDNAMTSVTDIRATLGALQSRMNSTVTSIDVTSENLSAAQSRIRDVDYASETAKETQAKILTQAGTAVLTQANQQPETVLQLLRG